MPCELFFYGKFIRPERKNEDKSGVYAPLFCCQSYGFFFQLLLMMKDTAARAQSYYDKALKKA